MVYGDAPHHPSCPAHLLICSEPTVIYNTAIVGALAGLAEYYGAGPWSGELQEVNQINYGSYLQQ